MSELLEALDDLADRFGWSLECRYAVTRLLAAGPTREVAQAAPVAAESRFLDLGPLARGGMGEVRRAHDTRLGREVAVKCVLPELAAQEGLLDRIRQEARITARLQHPGVLCVIDAGLFPDGRFWYAMPLVAGQTLTDEIGRVHEEVRCGAAEPQAGLHRLLTHFLRVCEVMAFAHDRHVIHRDLKPANVMVGRFGEVFVMDWGIAKDLTESAPPEALAPVPLPAGGSGLTTYGQAMGTPAYMPPEQARGALDLIDSRSDVFALGAVLHEVLTGRPPWPPRLTPQSAPLRPDEDLVRLCAVAMSPEPTDRPREAGLLAAAIRSWLDGAQRRSAAARHVEEARALALTVAAKREKAAAMRAEGTASLQRLEPTAGEEEKRRGWRLQDASAALEREARVDAAGVEQALRLALTLAPDHEVARAMLVDQYRERLLAAEAARDAPAAAEAEALLRANDTGLYAEWLRGEGRLTLQTRPDGAAVWLSTYTERDRRLLAEGRRLLGRTPLRDCPVPPGSHLLEVEHPACAVMRLPIHVGRQAEVRWRPPGRSEDLSLPLLPVAALGPDDVYVPAGWFPYQGDALSAEPLTRRDAWVDAYVIRRHPVTLAEIVDWLNDLGRNGRAQEAERFAPTLPPTTVGSASVLPIPRDLAGARHLPPEVPSLGRWPAVQMDWHAACTYADWLAARSGRPWRLLHEVEREKAARGTDGRLYPWGDFAEPTWCRNAGAEAAGPLPGPVDAMPRDESPYGVRGLAGNVRDWCLNVWTPDGGLEPDGRLVLRRPSPQDPAWRAIRGGCWSASIQLSRAAERFVGWPGERYPSAGFRLGYSLP